jgi:hypothetical protein
MHRVYLHDGAQTQRVYPGLDSMKQDSEGNILEQMKDFMEFSQLSRRSSEMPTVAYNHDIVHNSFSQYGVVKSLGFNITAQKD